jgi:hypothetical protein
VRARRPGAGCPGAAADPGRRAGATRTGATRAVASGGVEIAHVVDDGTNLLVLPIVRLSTMERLYVRGADLAIINSSACSLLALAERL